MQKPLISKIPLALMIVMLILAALPVSTVHAATRTASANGNWNISATWGGASIPGASDDVIINSGVTVTVPSGYPASCKSINFTTGTTGLSSITLAASSSSLTVSGAVTIQQQASGSNGNQINVGPGTFSAQSVALAATTDASRFSQILISTGTATVSGNITASGTASRITFSGTGRLNAGGNFMSGTAGTFTSSASTVNFNAAGAQTIGAYTFNDLVLSGSSAKTMPAGASVNGNLSITGSAKASVADGQNLSVETLTLGGLGTANGTWGSTSSTAANKNDNYFASTTGYLTVTTDTRTPQDTVEVTGPASVSYGTTGTISYTGGSGTGAVSYSHGSSTGCTVNSSTGVITVTNVSGSCIVTVTKAADSTYLEAPSDGFSVTLVPRAVTLTGSRVYDTTSLAAAGILSITNIVGSDSVTVASGSATLASPNVGTQPIISMNTLVLSGANAANYTLSGANGSVTITKADQATLTVTGPASISYGTTGTISYTGGSGTGAVSYSHGSSTGCTVNSSTGVITVTNLSGNCTVTLTKAADGNYNQATSAGFGVTLVPRAVTLTGSRVYDTTSVAAAGILSITNIVGSDSVTVASGSATLASPNVGSQPIISMNTLVLGGANAANYTLSGATGSVTITKANQATLTVTGPASIAYGTTGTITYTGGSGTGAVSYSHGSSTGCTVNSSTGLITVTNLSGSCTVTVTKATDSNYNQATSAGFGVTLIKADQATLTVTGPASITYGTIGTITHTGGSGTGAVSYSHGSSTGCTVNSSTGTITVTNASGSCIVTITKAADSNYNQATSVGFGVTLNKASQATLTVTGPASITYGTTGTITYTGGSGTGEMSYSQGASTGCTVNTTSGVIMVTSTLLSCTVTATKAADNNYLVTTSAGFVVALNKAAGSVSINNIPAMAVLGASFTPTFTKLGDGTAHVFSNTSDTCTLTGDVVTFVKLGTCRLQAIISAGTNYLAGWGPEQSFEITQGHRIYLPWVMR